MTDRIAVRGIRAWGRHGATPAEQEVPQALEIDLEIEVDLRAARATDRLDATVDYAALHAEVVRVVAERRCRLLERLGELVLASILTDARIVRARISIAKPGLLGGATPVVTLLRER